MKLCSRNWRKIFAKLSSTRRDRLYIRPRKQTRFTTPSSLSELRERIGRVVAAYLEPYRERLSSARLDEKLFRDPISGFQQLRPYEVLIVDSPLFQRLRGIFQTAVAYLTYPSSIHTRFEHSINCLYLADRVLDELNKRNFKAEPTHLAEVRLAALLHDIGHCIFSHGSEFFYRDFAELTSALDDPDIKLGNRSESELINYCIVTSKEFATYLWEPIQKLFAADSLYAYVAHVNLKRVAQMIIGAAPDDDPMRRFQTDIVNGPFDVDKLDYLRRDAYFTGISLTVDIDRLMPSLRVADVEDPERARTERRLVVDHRGIAVVEQLLFARMALYDTVYHHHKVRAANALLQMIFRKFHSKKAWPTTSRRLNSVVDFLEIDENDFFGYSYRNSRLRSDIRRLRFRELPERALVITPRALVDKQSHTDWIMYSADIVNRSDPVARRKGAKFIRAIIKKTVRYAKEAGASKITHDDVTIDIPDPPKYVRLGDQTLIQMVPDYVEPLKNLFPFQKVVNNYSTQYKYRSYVFSTETYKEHVAYGAFRAFKEAGIQLNDLSLILAHHSLGGIGYKNLHKADVNLPDWRKDYYTPDFSKDST